MCGSAEGAGPRGLGAVNFSYKGEKRSESIVLPLTSVPVLGPILKQWGPRLKIGL